MGAWKAERAETVNLAPVKTVPSEGGHPQTVFPSMPDLEGPALFRLRSAARCDGCPHLGPAGWKLAALSASSLFFMFLKRGKKCWGELEAS